MFFFSSVNFCRFLGNLWYFITSFSLVEFFSIFLRYFQFFHVCFWFFDFWSGFFKHFYTINSLFSKSVYRRWLFFLIMSTVFSLLRKANLYFIFICIHLGILWTLLSFCVFFVSNFFVIKINKKYVCCITLFSWCYTIKHYYFLYKKLKYFIVFVLLKRMNDWLFK